MFVFVAFLAREVPIVTTDLRVSENRPAAALYHVVCWWVWPSGGVTAEVGLMVSAQVRATGEGGRQAGKEPLF